MNLTEPVKLKPQHYLLAGALLVLIIFAIAGIALMPRPKPVPKAAAERTAAITIEDNTFTPASLTIKKGTKVTWHISGNDEDDYIVVSNPAPYTALPGLKSPSLHGNQTYSFVFDQPGSYGYHNQNIPTGGGTITVQE